jgi:hypothetical protein
MEIPCTVWANPKHFIWRMHGFYFIQYRTPDSTYGPGHPYCKCCYTAGPVLMLVTRVGQNHVHTVYIRYFGRKITKYTVIYGLYKRIWPTLLMTPVGRHVDKHTFFDLANRPERCSSSFSWSLCLPGGLRTRGAPVCVCVCVCVCVYVCVCVCVCVEHKCKNGQFSRSLHE